MTFDTRYSKLNEAQKEAVNYINGPLMVIAGPGTGKTELLSMRVANILKKTDTLAENILCLTFTESGVAAMRERLIGIIGKDAYKVGIYTFHSFGNDIIQTNSEFFYNGADYRPSDELTSREVLEKIFTELPHNNVLSTKNENEYTYLYDTLKVIGELKKSGLTSEELLSILNSNEFVIQKANQVLAPIFASKMNIKMIVPLEESLDVILSSSEKPKLLDLEPLASLISSSLSRAIDEARETNKTNSLTSWKNQWMIKNKNNQFELKSTSRQARLREVALVYDRYLHSMQENKLYDYDDMILRALHACEIFPELRYNLQEKYQYIMIDEFQDTNLAQMRLIHSLTDSEINQGSPNIMVVGDDDQAIYSFQGADVSNILSFNRHYPSTKVIALTQNYRSGSDILKAGRHTIIQGQNRLETNLQNLSKQLTSQEYRGKGRTTLWSSPSLDVERNWLAQSIRSAIDSGELPSDIAVITRNHKQINDLLPYLSQLDIPVTYERKDNILDQPAVAMLYKLAKLTVLLSQGRLDEFNGLLPEIMAHPAWGISAETMLNISLKSYKEHSYWIESMEHFDETKDFREFLISLARDSEYESLENILDMMLGAAPVGDYTSPLKEFFFSANKIAVGSEDFINHLLGLRTLRRKMKEYRPNETPSLSSFIEFVDSHKKAHAGIELINNHAGSSAGVNILTAHKAKGLEFNTVYIFNAADSTWGRSARKISRKISYPENLPLEPAGDSDDEKLRLFYVAMTRAKDHLNISYSATDDKDKASELLEYLVSLQVEKIDIEKPTDAATILSIAETSWNQNLNINQVTLEEILTPVINRYKLSATHLNNFLDITRGGPQNFLFTNLLRFPQAMSASAAFGSSIHDTLNLAHQNISAGNPPQAIEDILSNFEINLSRRHMSKKDFEHYRQKGFDCLGVFLEKKYKTFNQNQRSEVDFINQGSVVNDAILTGKIDLVDFGLDKTISITDYKTGKAPQDWKGKDSKEKIKLYKYRQQLIFYKIMLEESKDYGAMTISSASLSFVEPDHDGKIIDLAVDFDEEETKRLKQLIGAVWRKITSLDFPETSGYPQTLAGIMKFEEDLIKGDI